MNRLSILLLIYCCLSSWIPPGHAESLMVNTLAVPTFIDHTLDKGSCNAHFGNHYDYVNTSGPPTVYQCIFHVDYNPICHQLSSLIHFCGKSVKRRDVTNTLKTFQTYEPTRPRSWLPARNRFTTNHHELQTYTPRFAKSLTRDPMLPILDEALVNTTLRCLISGNDLCDGFSMCLTDECGCKDVDVFYCADSAGCIAHANVCDGVEDCRDGSDECMCDDVIHCTYKDHAYCIPRSKYCFYRMTTHRDCRTKEAVDCSQFGEEEAKKKNYITPFHLCYEEFMATNSPNTLPWNFNGYFREFCEKNCDPKWSKMCQYLKSDSTSGLFFKCVSREDANPIMPGKATVLIDNVCDGVTDCSFGNDEIYCPDVYFCNDSTTTISKSTAIVWINRQKLCDNKKDCPAGDDECQRCFEGGAGVGSDRNMVESKVVRGFMVAGTVLTLSLNIFAGIEIASKDAESRTAKVDQLILLVLCGYDMLMGLCVGFTFFKSMLYSGKYCFHDKEWRASLQCKFLGCFFSLSAHGSLLMISILSLTRCYKCVFNRTVKVKVIAAVAMAVFIVNAFHAVLPILPISGVQDIFRASMTFTDNPFVNKYNKAELARKYRLYKGDNVNTPSTYAMLDQLNNISSKLGMFDPEELGYYSYSPLCIQNIFGHQDSLVWYKVVYILVIITVLVLTSVSYAAIVFHTFKVSNAVQQGASNKVTTLRVVSNSFKNVVFFPSYCIQSYSF